MKTEFIAIEFPGIVKNLDKAFEMMGGMTKLSKNLLDDDSVVQVNYRPNNPLSHPITARRTDNPRMFVCTRQDDNNTENIEITQISTLLTFRQLFDMQYSVDLQANPMKFLEAIRTVDHKSLENYHALISQQFELLPPPEFMQIRIPLNYGFKQFKYVAKEDQESTLKDSAWKFASTDEIKLDYVQQLESFSDTVLLEELRGLFQDRPVWLHNSLKSQLKTPNVTDQLLKTALPHIAFLFVTGPWKSCWIRHGYDPREDMESRIYQNLTVRSKSKEENSDSVVFGTYQMIDVTEPSAKKFVDLTDYLLESCDPKSGWYPTKQLQIIRDVLREVYRKPELVVTQNARKSYEQKQMEQLKEGIAAPQQVPSSSNRAAPTERALNLEVQRHMDQLINETLQDDEWIMPTQEAMEEYDIFGLDDDN